jgi:hypothetical protein
VKAARPIGRAVLAVAAAFTAQAAAGADLLLRAGTLVPLETRAHISSKTHRQGDRFELSVSEDVIVDGKVAIPKGAVALAEVADHRAKGSFGRSGKLEVTFLYVTVGDRKIRLDGRAADSGRNVAVPALATSVVVAGVVGASIKGGDARIPAGSPMAAYVHRDLLLAPAR